MWSVGVASNDEPVVFIQQYTVEQQTSNNCEIRVFFSMQLAIN